MRRPAGRDWRRGHRPDAFGSYRFKPFRQLIGKQPAPGALSELMAQREIAESVKRVVEIDEELAPLHARDVRRRVYFQTRHRELAHRIAIILFDHNIT